jgi:hypothetical protein
MTDKHTEEIKRHIDVLKEHFDDKVEIIAEQYGDIQNKLQGLEKTQNAQTEMIGNLAVDLTIVKEDVEFIKTSLKKKVDVDEFSMLERRVSRLESQLHRT